MSEPTPDQMFTGELTAVVEASAVHPDNLSPEDRAYLGLEDQ